MPGSSESGWRSACPRDRGQRIPRERGTLLGLRMGFGAVKGPGWRAGHLGPLEPEWGFVFLSEVSRGGQVRLNGGGSCEWGWMLGSSSRASVVQPGAGVRADASVDGWEVHVCLLSVPMFGVRG